MATKAKIVSLKIAPTMLKTSGGGFDLYWDVQVSGFTPTFMAQYSYTEHGSWSNLYVNPIAAYQLTGVGPKRLSFQEDVFFRLLVYNSATLIETGVAVEAGEKMNLHDWRIYREMVRREALELNKYTGDKGMLLRRIVYGTKCTACSDETLNDSASAECGLCYGTGFESGFYPPVVIKANWSYEPSAPNSTILEGNGPSEVIVCDAVFPPYPTMKFKDIYVDLATNHRYEIRSASADEYHGGTIRQVVVMSRLPPTDPVYQVPIAI